MKDQLPVMAMPRTTHTEAKAGEALPSCLARVDLSRTEAPNAMWLEDNASNLLGNIEGQAVRKSSTLSTGTKTRGLVDGKLVR